MAVERIIGIDFGTSTSMIKVKTYKDGRSINDKVLADYIEFNNNSTVPTLVFETSDGGYACGYEAEHAAVKGLLHRNFKLDLLSMDEEKRALAEKLTGLFLKHLYDRYDSQKTHYPKCDIETTYISYPAKWPKHTRDFMIKAAAQAGFENVQGMDEPSAAIHTVLVQESEGLQKKGLLNGKEITILMVDMGAGTTDLALCKYRTDSRNQVEVLCTWPEDMGHSLFGGREIDEMLGGYVKQYLLQSGMTNVKNFEQRYMSQCKSWKENNVAKELYKGNEVKYCAFIDPILEMLGVDNEFPPLDRRKFEEMACDYLRQFPQMVNDCLDKAFEQGKLSGSEEVDLVILAGGHSQWYFADEILTDQITYLGTVNLPKIQRDGAARVIRLASPQETVAYGLVYQRLSVSEAAPKPVPEVSQGFTTAVNERGNTCGNIANRGLAAKQGDWIYYNNFNDGRKLFKERTNGCDKVKLCDDDCEYINVVGDWIYYSNTSEWNKLYKIRTDGTERIILVDKQCAYISVFGGWIYYVEDLGGSMDSGGYIYKIRTDGSSRTLISDGYCTRLCVAGDNVYYNRESALLGLLPINKIYKARVDGHSTSALRNDKCFQLVVEDNCIYYHTSENGIFRLTSDGVIKQKICSDNCSFINAVDVWLYYRNLDDGGKLYRVRTDGSQKTLISDEECHWINIAGEWIYYTTENDRFGTLYKMRIDGTSRQRVSCY